MSKIPNDRIVVNELMAFSAEELADHALGLAKEIRNGDYEDDGLLSLPVALGHLMDHLVGIWHLSKITDDEYDRETQADYESRCLMIPRLKDGYKIVEID